MGLKVFETFEQLTNLKNHYILCGVGRTGSHIVERFVELQTPFVAVEKNAATLTQLQEIMAEKGRYLHCINADATEDETLEEAGIRQAKGLITALDDDKENLFVILTARALNPNVYIVARVNDDKLNREKLEKAGADKVVSTNVISGLRMASEMIRPEVVDFLDQMMRVSEKNKTLRFTELPLTDIKTPGLKELIEANRQTDDHAHPLHINDIGKHTGLLVVAIKTRKEEQETPHSNSFYPQKRYRFTPRGNERLHSDDILVVIGTQEKLDEVLGDHPY